MRWLYGLASGLLLLSVESFACRCEQLPLADYFGQAEYVAMARLVAAETGAERRVLEFELLAAPYKGGREAQAKGAAVRFETPLSTASCGIQPDPDAIYVVFATAGERADMLSVNSCNGTRVHLSAQLPAPVGFIDVPARFVAGQLNAHFGLEVLRDVAAHAPRPADPDNRGLIGLLDLEPLAHGGFVRLRRAPSSSSALVGDVHSYDDVDSREFAYEQSGAVVYAKLPGWYRLRTAEGAFGWLSAEEAGTWFPYEQLPVRRLAYLTDEWSGLTWPDAGAGLPVRKDLISSDRPREYPVNVLASREIGGMPWFHVELLRGEPCSGAEPEIGTVGWVPAYGRHGKPVVWFYSRGC